MPSDIIQWFPGHMAKTRRLIKENLSSVDIVLEILDARIPESSKNPELSSLIHDKPVISVLNKAGLADPVITKKWIAFYQSIGRACVACDCISGYGMKNIGTQVKELLADKLKRYADKGMQGRTIKAMILGIPNVGKSSLINRISQNKKAKVENRPGVTLTKQWVKTNIGIDLLDMPGVLWPKFEDQRIGENLAITGAIKDDILDIERIATALCDRLRSLYPEQLAERYRLSDDLFITNAEPHELLIAIAKKRGCLLQKGEVDIERASNLLIDEFRAAKIGKISLEVPTC